MRVHHLAVLVADLVRAEAFYAGVLGLRVTARHPDAHGAPRSVWLDAGGAILMLERATPGTPRRADGAPGWHCVALAITQAERATWRARLVAAGHPIERESAYTLYVRDPDGALVALSYYTPPDEVAPPDKAT